MLTADLGVLGQSISLIELEILIRETTSFWNIPGLKDPQGPARWHVVGSPFSGAPLEGNENQGRKTCLPATMRSNDSCYHTKEGC